MHLKEASCAANISSKLKVSPSHSVNSPSWFPVRRRRPPGVKERVMTGEEFLARVTCAMCVRNAVDGVWYGMDDMGSLFRRR